LSPDQLGIILGSLHDPSTLNLNTAGQPGAEIFGRRLPLEDRQTLACRRKSDLEFSRA
jgi:hypothetical protein